MAEYYRNILFLASLISTYTFNKHLLLFETQDDRSDLLERTDILSVTGFPSPVGLG